MISAATIRPLNRATTLCHISTDRFKTARLTFLTVRPADETESPLATLLYGIMRRGSEHYPRLALLNRRLDELYGTTLTIRNYLHGDNHIISFTAELLESDYLLADDRDMDILDGVLDMLADMLLRPLKEVGGELRHEAVEAEKQSLCDSLRSLQNDTRTLAADRFRRLMCPDEPYGLSIGGTPESVMALTPADVTAHREAHLDTATCFVLYAGRADMDRVASLWDKHFGAWNPMPALVCISRPHPIPAVPRSLEDSWPVGQGKLCLGWSCGETEATLDIATAAALAVCNEVFGVMQSSLLFCHVREELGLCYYCESALDMTKGILWVASGIHPDRREEAERAIRAQLFALQNGDVDPADIELGKLSLLNSYRQIGDSHAAMEAYMTRALLGGRLRTPEEQMTAIRAVTPADVMAAARRFVPDTTYFLRGTELANDEEDCADE